MDVNLELYKVFYSVAKNRSITKAAEELAVTQPAVTKAIKNLERQLGGTLFIRSTKGLGLTPEGEVLLHHVSKALDIFNAAENVFLDFSELKTGEVRIGASSVLTRILLVDAIKEFMDKYPNIKITIKNDLTTDLINDLNKGNLDFVIYNEGIAKVSGIEANKLTSLRYVFACKKGTSDPLQMPLIKQDKNSFTRKFMEKYLSDNWFELEEGITVVSQDLAARLASNGLGICFIFEKLLGEYDLMALDSFPEVTSDIFIATNKFSTATVAADRFLSLLKKQNA